jgi:HipA-like C-terminal domain
VTDQWNVVDASSWTLAGEEPQGLRPHQWLRHESRKRTWLFKHPDEEPDRPLGEDVTEKLASELASVFGIPAARVELAVRDDRRGCLVEDLRWSKGSHEPGQTLLAEVVEGYNPQDPEHRGHNVASIRQALERFTAPPASPTPEGYKAFDVFAGYLVFDALIANGDRHDRNWAVLIRPPGISGNDALCGSYDHASSLGFNLSDEERLRRLSEGMVESWARRGAARQFEHRRGERRQSLVELACSAVAQCAVGVRQHWLDAVLSVESGVVGALLDAAPGLSDTTWQFTKEVIMINRERLLDALQ